MGRFRGFPACVSWRAMGQNKLFNVFKLIKFTVTKLIVWVMI